MFFCSFKHSFFTNENVCLYNCNEWSVIYDGLFKRASTGSGLILASSPAAKKEYGISNVSRPRDLPQPFPKTLHVVSPRMNLYIKRNMQVNNIFRKYVADEDLLIYSIDESILKVTRSLNLFTTEETRSQRRKKLAQMIQENIKEELG
ncbi:hypothetical protein MYY10_002583, partial [Enterococcus faecium]|nr:hypothetical protein [Enterococcus faecium]